MRRVFAVIVSFVMAFILPVSTYAISESKLNFFAQNNILFYDPGATTCGYGTIAGSTLFEKVLSFLMSTGLNGVAAAGVYGNMMREGLGSGALLSHEDGVDSRSDIGTWYKAATHYGENGLYVQEKDVRDLDDPNIMHGLGFIQWSFERRVNFLNALANAGGLDQYAREWDDAKGRYVYDGMSYDQMVEAIGQETTDAILQAELDFFNSEHENYTVTSDDIAAQGLSKYGITSGMPIMEALNLVSTPEEAAEIFFSTSEMPSYTHFSDDAQKLRGVSAAEGYELIKSAGLTANGATSCGNNDGIVNTALMLAWNRETEGRHDKDDPKSEYEQAMREVGTWFANGPCSSPTTCAPNGASCDVFVSTVMRYSGADPDFPAVFGGSGDRDPSEPDLIVYLENHPEMYMEIENLQDTSNLQAGDIFVIANNQGRHIFIYMGVVDGRWMQASASFNSRTGEYFAYENYTDYGGLYRIFRRI